MKKHIRVQNKSRKTCSKMYAFYLLRSPAGVQRYGVEELWRNAADGGAHWDIGRGAVVGTVLVLAVTGDATAGQSCGLVQGH